MKLAEALQERADINRRIAQLRDRLGNNALVQEGERPAEDPAMLKQELDAAVSRLQWLMARINLTNARVEVDGRTLTELIAEKDALTVRISAYRAMVYQSSQTAYRARSTEIRIMPAINVKDWQSEVDAMSKNLRLLDNRLQQSNWNTDLLE